MNRTAQDYEHDTLVCIHQADEAVDKPELQMALIGFAQIYATLAHAAAIVEQTEQARKWEEERQSK